MFYDFAIPLNAMSSSIAPCRDTLVSLGMFLTTNGMEYISSAIGMFTMYAKVTQDTVLF